MNTQKHNISQDTVPAEQDDDELLMLHTALHSYYREFEIGRGIEDWELDEVVQMHRLVVDEMESRDLPHQELNGLDNETEVNQWVQKFVEAEHKEQFVQEKPPSTDWLLQTFDEVEEIDPTIDLNEYITLSATDIDDLDPDEHPVQWLQSGGSDVVGYFKDEDEGVILTREESTLTITANDGTVYETDRVDSAYCLYQDIVALLKEGEEIEQAVDLAIDPEPDEVVEEEVEQEEVEGEVEDNEIELEQNRVRPFNEDSDIRWVHTVDQQGDGLHVLVAGAISRTEDFWLCIHTSGDQYDQPDGPSMGSSHGEVGPFSAGDEVIPTAFMLEEPISHGQQFFVSLHEDDDGEKGDHITDDNGNFIFDSAQYIRNPDHYDEDEDEE